MGLYWQYLCHFEHQAGTMTGMSCQHLLEMGAGGGRWSPQIPTLALPLCLLLDGREAEMSAVTGSL